MRRHLVLKLVGTSLVIGVFIVVYLHLLHRPSYPVTMMPSTALDRLLPFQPRALFLYLALWLTSASDQAATRFLDLVNYTAWAVMLCAAGLLIFYFWPTQIPPLGLTFPLTLVCVAGIDAAGNTCPSMHVAFHRSR
jgi:hypothetical protein